MNRPSKKEPTWSGDLSVPLTIDSATGPPTTKLVKTNSFIVEIADLVINVGEAMIPQSSDQLTSTDRTTGARTTAPEGIEPSETSTIATATTNRAGVVAEPLPILHLWHDGTRADHPSLPPKETEKNVATHRLNAETIVATPTVVDKDARTIAVIPTVVDKDARAQAETGRKILAGTNTVLLACRKLVAPTALPVLASEFPGRRSSPRTDMQNRPQSPPGQPPARRSEVLLGQEPNRALHLRCRSITWNSLVTKNFRTIGRTTVAMT